MSRREFEMSDEQLKRLLDARRPVPYMVMGGVAPAGPQESANSAWQTLGRELGFKWDTVMPVPGKPQRYFTAVPTVDEVEPMSRWERVGEVHVDSRGRMSLGRFAREGDRRFIVLKNPEGVLRLVPAQVVPQAEVPAQ